MNTHISSRNVKIEQLCKVQCDSVYKKPFKMLVLSESAVPLLGTNAGGAGEVGSLWNF